MKIWICGSVSAYGEEENIKELVKVFKYFNGAFFNVNYNNINSIAATAQTYESLDRHKGEGKIVYTPWLQRHDWAMNAFLNMVPNGDAFMYIDAQELPKIEFLEQMRPLIEKCQKEGVDSIWWNRPYIMLNKRPEMQFVGNPHAWLQGLNNKYINIADESKVRYDEGGCHFGDFIYNKKKLENTRLLHGIKYSLYDLPNNQFQMFYPKNPEYTEHEAARRSFCKTLDEKEYERTLEGLELFFKEKANLTGEIINYLNFEFVFRDFYRYKILKHSIDDIIKDRYNYRIDYV